MSRPRVSNHGAPPAHVPGPQLDMSSDSLSNAPNGTNHCKSAPDEDNTDMTTPTFRYGRRPPKNAPALRLAPLLTGALPPPPSHVDYGTDFTGWQMLGNDVAGDCVAVTWANQRALVTKALSQKNEYPHQTEVL